MPIDYGSISEVVEIDVSLPSFGNSPLIMFEMSYKIKEGNYQIYTFPTYSSKIKPIIIELKRRRLITENQSHLLNKKLKSLEDKLKQSALHSRIA